MKLMKLIELYHHPWCPRFFFKKFDGGKGSGVTGRFLVEFKPLFSIGLLHFKNGSRPSYHNHAFNALSWFIWGHVTEEHRDGTAKEFAPSLLPKFTPRSCFHRVVSHGDTWCLTLRGPWASTWQEYRPKTNELVTLTHGRKEVETSTINLDRRLSSSHPI